MISDAELDAMQARCDAATPCEMPPGIDLHVCMRDGSGRLVVVWNDLGGRYIGHVRTDLPRALARIRELKAEVERKRDKLLRIAAIMNALHNGDDSELTPRQARSAAINAVCEVLGVPF